MACCSASDVKTKPSDKPPKASDKPPKASDKPPVVLPAVVKGPSSPTLVQTASATFLLQAPANAIAAMPASKPSPRQTDITGIEVQLPRRRHSRDQLASVTSMSASESSPNAANVNESARGKASSRDPLQSAKSTGRRSAKTNEARAALEAEVEKSLEASSNMPSSRRRRSKKSRTSSATYFTRALDKYPKALHGRMKAAREGVDDIPDTASPFLGIEISGHDSRLTVESVTDGGPANIVGILPGDIITGIGATSFPEGMPLPTAIGLLRSACHVGRVVPIRYVQRGMEQEAPLWIMTTDADLSDRPYYFQVSSSRIITRRKSSFAK